MDYQATLTGKEKIISENYCLRTARDSGDPKLIQLIVKALNAEYPEAKEAIAKLSRSKESVELMKDVAAKLSEINNLLNNEGFQLIRGTKVPIDLKEQAAKLELLKNQIADQKDPLGLRLKNEVKQVIEKPIILRTLNQSKPS